MPVTHPPAPYWQERRLRAMGSTAWLAVGDAEEVLADWAVAELRRLERSWSRFDPASELNAVNARPGTWTAVSPSLLLAVGRAVELWTATGGAFDPTVLDALERAGYDRSFDLVPPDGPSSDRPPTPTPGASAVEVDASGGALRLAPGCRIDLGGVGKGLAADLVAQGLVDRGARSALVNLGGDIRACGVPPEDGWPIPVEHPFDEGRTLFTHPLRFGAVVTSTTRFRSWRRSGRPAHHIIDPATGLPASHTVAAVVATAAEAWWAEGIAKSVIVLGLAPGLELLRKRDVDAWVFGNDGVLLATVQES